MRCRSRKVKTPKKRPNSGLYYLYNKKSARGWQWHRQTPCLNNGHFEERTSKHRRNHPKILQLPFVLLVLCSRQ
jgi:hypothetical protein